MIGRTVSHYRIISLLGAGGMGEVFRAEDTKLKRTVALKFLPPELTRDAEAKRRFLHEAEAAAALDHPNICTVYEVGETEDGQLFIAMACYTGETLRDRIARGPLPLAEALRIAGEAAAGLADAHARGIVHRDVKPANLFVTEGGLVKVLDFGLAKLAGGSALTRSGTTLGTAAYMSPEQARGMGADARTDIWSLGVVLYEMVAGRPPFAGEYTEALMYGILNEEPPPLTALRTGVPIQLDGVIAKVLAKDPEERYQTLADLAVDLRMVLRAISGKVGPATPVPGLGPTPRPEVVAVPAKRPVWRRWRAWAAAAAVVLAVAGALYFWVGRPVEKPAAPPEPGRVAAAKSPESPPEKSRVVAVVFDNRTGDRSLDSLGVQLADRITAGLSQVGGITVVTDPGLAAAVAKPGATALHDLAQRTGAGLVIAGAIYANGPDLELQGRLVEPLQGKQIYAVDPAQGPRSKLDPAIEALRQRILGAVAAYFDDFQFDPSVMRPPTFEAYQEMVRARELWQRDYDKAIAHLQRALQLDPKFVVGPRYEIFLAFYNQGKYEEAAKQIAALEPFLSEMTPFERLQYIDMVACLAGEWSEDLTVVRQMNEMSPRLERVKVARAICELFLNQPRAVIRTLNTISPVLLERTQNTSRGWGLGYRSVAHHLLGEYEEQLADAREGRACLPGDFYAHEAAALAALGRIAEMERVIEEAEAVPRKGIGLQWWLMMRRAMVELRAHGRREASIQMADRALRRLRALPPEELKTASTRGTLLSFLWGAERWSEVQAITAELPRERPENIGHLGLLGRLACRLGNQAEARRVEEQLAAVKRPYLYGAHTYQRACIAALLGEKERAVALLREAVSQGYVDWWRIRHEIDLEPLHGYPPFEELVKPKG